jgi:phospholipase C
MLGLRLGLLSVSVVGLAMFLVSCGSTSTSHSMPGPGQIKHVVIVFQENRTPDNLFHDSVLISRGADIASQGKTSSGQTIPLTSTSLGTTYDLGHDHGSFLAIWDHGAMDGADKIVCGPSCPPNPQYQYVQQPDVRPYFTMAETYTFGDRMFQTNEGPSFPAHQYIISGTSAISATSTTSVAENPGNNQQGYGTGCLAAPGTEVNAIDTSNPDPYAPEFTISQLCYEHATLTDLLDAANLNWKYYAPAPGSIWTAPDAIQHMCVPSGNPPSCTGPDWTNPDPHVVIEGSKSQIISDIAAGNLAAVSWVIPAGQNSDHPGGNQIGGPSWVAAIVNAIGQSQYWADTAIIVTWDDWGGWYDHVAPPQIRDSYEPGLRVPLIVISAYAKAAYISHVNHDFGSILKFVEKTFNLGEIDPSQNYADSHAFDDLSDCFDFNQTPLVFTQIQAPLGAAHFLNDQSPPAPPDND